MARDKLLQAPLPEARHRSSGSSVGKALVGFINTKAAEGLSPLTLQSYEHCLKQRIDYAGEADIEMITPY